MSVRKGGAGSQNPAASRACSHTSATVGNAGTIRGNGVDVGGINSRPSGGIVIAQPGSIVTNAGQISGAANGVITSYFFSEDENGERQPIRGIDQNQAKL